MTLFFGMVYVIFRIITLMFCVMMVWMIFSYALLSRDLRPRKVSGSSSQDSPSGQTGASASGAGDAVN